MSILSVQNISKSYKLRQVVKAISLEIKSGEVVGLLGPGSVGAARTCQFERGRRAFDISQTQLVIDELQIGRITFDMAIFDIDDNVSRELPDAVVEIEFAGAAYVGLYADIAL